MVDVAPGQHPALPSGGTAFLLPAVRLHPLDAEIFKQHGRNNGCILQPFFDRPAVLLLHLPQQLAGLAVRQALKHPNGAKLSDNQIAEHVGVDHKTVAKYRDELDLGNSQVRTGRDGRIIDTSKIGTTKALEKELESTCQIDKSPARTGRDGRIIARWLVARVAFVPSR